MSGSAAPRGHAAAAAAGAVFGAFVAAKGLAVLAVPTPPSWSWLPCDDAVVALGGGFVAAAVPWLRWLLVPTLVAFAGLHVLTVRALGMPFLPSMLRGLDPAMGDSAVPYLTLANAAAVLLVVAMAWLGARVGRRAGGARRRGRAMGGAGVLAWRLGAVLAVGSVMVQPAPAHASQRNAVFAFVRALQPRGPVREPGGCAQGHAARATSTNPPGSPPAATASPWAGIAAGRSVVVVVLESAATRFVAPAAPAVGPGAPLPMPFLRELAAIGLDCPQAWAVYPESIEGQVPIFCGLPPRVDAEPSDYRAHAAFALPHRLRPHGYRSALFHAGRFRFLGMHDVLAPMGFDLMADAGGIGGERESSFGIDEEATVDALLRWVAAQDRTRPLCACYLPIAGHHPYGSPPGGPFANDSMRGCYQNALHYADRALQRLWRGLLAQRPAEQWLVCVVGDHGQAFGEHAGNFGHSFELYEENLRVPLVLVAPGSGLVGVHDAPCSHLDVVPALLALLGLDGADEPRPALLAAPDPQRIVAAFTDWGELLVAARDGRWKLIHDVVAGTDRLFDLRADPDERSDRAAAEPQQAARLRTAALAFLRSSDGEPGR